MDNLIMDAAEEEIFLQQLEVARSQKMEFSAETERIYVKLLWRKVLTCFW